MGSLRVQQRRLRLYQTAAFAYTRRATHPALFMEMRLGKTLVAIRRINTYPGRQRVLIVAPLTVLDAWRRELELEGEPTPAMLIGTRPQRLQALERQYKWNLINKEGFFALPEIANIRWTVVVLDESTFIKNPKAKVTKFFLKNFREVPHRWILTGTPNPESSLNVITQFGFLDGGNTFGDYWRFRAKHCQVFGQVWVPKPGVREMIARRLGDRAYILQRKDVQAECLKIYEPRFLQLPKQLGQLYEEAENTFILGEQKMRFKIEMFTALRRLTSGCMDGKQVWAGKADELINLLTGELQGQQVIVWFEYLDSLIAVSRALDRAQLSYREIQGAVSAASRSYIMKEFTSGDCQVLLVQVRTGMFGIDLSCCDTCIYFEVPTSMLARAQSEDRILLPGKTTPLLYIDLVVKNTVDADIYEAIVKKREDMESLLHISNVIKMRKQNASKV